MFGFQPDHESHDAFVGFRAVYDNARKIVIQPDRVSKRRDEDETSVQLLDLLTGDTAYDRMEKFVRSAVPYAYGLCDDVYTLESMHDYQSKTGVGRAKITIKARASGEYLYVSMYADRIGAEVQDEVDALLSMENITADEIRRIVHQRTGNCILKFRAIAAEGGKHGDS